MNAKGKTSSKDNKMKVTTSTLMRGSGVSALLAGLCLIFMGMFHPANVPASATAAVWEYVHIAATAMCFFGLFGMVGLYARQSEKTGWLGLAGFLLISIWFGIVLPYSFIEAFILPKLAASSPAFIAGWMGMFNGVSSEIDLGILPTLWNISNPIYILGPLLFGIATFRAGVLPRWAGALFILGALLPPVAAMVPPEAQMKILLPYGFAFVWLGYALFSERQEKSSDALIVQRNTKAEPNKVV